MKILALETSCDDTAISVVEDGVSVLSHVKHSQVEHNEYGGVVPEIAARLHSENWRPVLEECLEIAKMKIEDIDYLAVTSGPGLQTSLLTGTTAASFLSFLYNKPLIPVHHTYGHISSTVLERTLDEFEFPALVLTVSGGHTDIYEYTDFVTVKKLGGTLDDAAGEAFDKCSKMLGLGYPGGPIVGRWAEKGDVKKYKFPRILLGKESLDFSFSGLKAAVYRVVEAEKEKGELSDEFKENVCASFQECVKEIFEKKVIRAFDFYPHAKALHFVGGVSANKVLRESLENLCERYQRKFYTTKKFLYSTDNGAMIGAAAYLLLKKNQDIAKIQYVDGNSRQTL